MSVTAAYAGLRPASEHKDYQIRTHADRRWITVGGIRSTGLTGALGIARHVWSLYEGLGARHTAPAAPAWPHMPNIAEHRIRDFQQPGYGEIVCHCELVTRREIEAALTGPLPAGDLGGLKRRTRAMMGRCQGFYCSAHVCAIAKGRIAMPDPLGEALP
jgi:glycerol-3-phosphate dehydrogenase